MGFLDKNVKVAIGEDDMFAFHSENYPFTTPHYPLSFKVQHGLSLGFGDLPLSRDIKVSIGQDDEGAEKRMEESYAIMEKNPDLPNACAVVGQNLYYETVGHSTPALVHMAKTAEAMLNRTDTEALQRFKKDAKKVFEPFKGIGLIRKHPIFIAEYAGGK